MKTADAGRQPATDSSILRDVPPVRLFGRADFQAWRWLHLEGREQCPFLAEYLPSVPPEALQASITGAYFGREGLEHGHDTYLVIQNELNKHAHPLKPSAAVLDFGCGWGRIIRFFTRDVEPQNLWGLDIWEPGIQACRETNRWARFEQNEPLPPTQFDDGTFDLIYSYSVFSHLAEEPHLTWLEELERILKPSGLFVSTTLTREYAEMCGELARRDPESLPEWERLAAESLPQPDEFLAAYDRGEYCFSPVATAQETLGITCIPEEYVRRRWSQYFEVRDYFTGPGQAFITCRKG
jgi:SAM-dependent methyltransferase